MFQIDESKYRVIDISATVVLGQGGDRPFEATRGYLADMSYKYDITNTHTHVGSHVESAAHFFDDGASIDQYPLSAFYGRGVLLDVDAVSGQHITADYIESRIGDILRAGDIIVCRNASPDKKFFTEESAVYLRGKTVKMVALGSGVGLGDSVESGRAFHDVLMRETTFLEIIDNVDQISKREFFVMALPFLVKGSDSGWCRAIVIEDK